MKTPSPWVLVLSALLAGLIVAVLIVALDLDQDRVSIALTLALGVLLCAAVAVTIEVILARGSMKGRAGTYAVYDPRAGREYPMFARHGGLESSHAANVFVIDAKGVDWMPIAAELDALFEASGRAGYVVYWPWWPGLKKKIASFRAVFPHGSGNFEQVAVQSLTDGFAATVLSLRASIGDATGGTWVFGVGEEIGALSDALDRVARSDPYSTGVDLIGASAATIVLDEGGLSVLLVNLEPALLDTINRVSIALTAAGYQLRESGDR